MMPDIRQIHDALHAVEELPPGFPFGKRWRAGDFRALSGVPHLSDWLKDMRAFARSAAETPAPPLRFSDYIKFETEGSREEFQDPYFGRRGRLAALVFASLTGGTDEYIPALQDLIWEICGEYAWAVPAHLPIGEEAGRSRLPPSQIVDLFAAETAHALAESLWLMKGRLDDKIEARIRQEIERRVFRPVFHEPVHFGWELSATNWASVCAGSVGMAALLLETDRERLAGMLSRVIRTLECFLEGYGDDGGCAEGVGYWVYGFGYYVYFADMLVQFTDGRLNLLDGDKIRRMSEFPCCAGMSGEMYVNYSDAVSYEEMHTGLVSRLAALNGARVPSMSRVTPFHADGAYRFAHLARNLFWSDASLLGRPWETGTYHMENLSWVLDRRQLAGLTVAFSAKGGHNDEPHNHNDLGQFILHADGENVLADLGAGRYTREYFGPNRYSIIHNSSEGHSVPIVNGRPQSAGNRYSASEVRYEQSGKNLIFELDLTHAYDQGAGLAAFRRLFEWQCDDEACMAVLDLKDIFVFEEQPREVEEIFISLRMPELMENRLIWNLPQGRWQLEFNEDEFEAGIESLDSDTGGHPVSACRIRMKAVNPKQRMECGFRFTFAAARKES